MGTPERIYGHPISEFIEGFLGAANFIAGTAHREPDGTVLVDSGDLQLRGVTHLPLDGKSVVVLRPEDGSLHAHQPEQPGNALPGDVVHSEFLGGRWRHVVI